jgi:hypothetical protein
MTDAADEIERLQIIIDNMAERNQKQNAEQLRIVRAVEADRDRWKSVADELYKHVCTDWCWHCGAERTRNIYASNAVDMYREAVESEC